MGPRSISPTPHLTPVPRSPSPLSHPGGRPPPGHPEEREPRVKCCSGNNGEGRWICRCVQTRRPRHPTPQAPDAPGTRRLTAGPLELTTPPRGPVFPGEPWKKKLGHSEMSSPGKGGPLAPCSSWSNPTPRPTAAQTWPLSLSSLPWYLISFDAWQALGSWNSWGALLSFGALRWGEKKQNNAVN